MGKWSIVFNVIVTTGGMLRKPEMISSGDCSGRLPGLGVQKGKPRVTLRYGSATMIVEVVVGVVAHGYCLDTLNLG
jgi:hypothetical protein